MKMQNTLDIKKDILKFINKGRRTDKKIDEERFLIFTQQLCDISILEIGPLNAIETRYLRCVYDIIEEPKESVKKEIYTMLNLTYERHMKDTVFWMILTKLAYHLKIDSEFGIAKEKKSIAIDELEINGALSTELNSLDIQIVDQLIELPLEEIFQKLGRIKSTSLKYMLYELYELVHSLGYQFKGEEKRDFVKLNEENAEELLEKKVTEVSFADFNYNKHIQTYLRNQKIYTLGDLVSFTTEELQEKNIGKHMYNCLLRAAHDMGLAFANEYFIYIKNPYFKKNDNSFVKQEIQEKIERLACLTEKCDKKILEKAELENRLKAANQNLENIVNSLKEDDKEFQINI